MNYCDVQQLFDTLMPAGDFRCYWKARYLTDLTDEMIDLGYGQCIGSAFG